MMMMMVSSVNGSDLFDGFDRIPDPIVLHIFNKVSDVKTLIRCRCVSRRFNSLVPQTDSLLLRVDRVISAADSDFLDFHGGGDDGSDSSFLLTLLASLLKPLHNLFASSTTTTTTSKSVVPSPARSQSPTQILRCFERVRNLRVELPAGGGARIEKGTCVKWKAAFGKTLKHCVIFAFRESGSESERNNCIASGLKTRVVWTISALMAASARHYMILEAINEQKGIENLVIQDRECEGTVVMDKCGLQECREELLQGDEEDNVEYNTNNTNRMGGMWWRNNRTTVPAVRMRMRHEARLELSGGARMEGATLVVVRPISDGNPVEDEQNGDVELAMEAFGVEGGVYSEAVQSLLKSRSYILEMNSF